jgi:hypothetical protein
VATDKAVEMSDQPRKPGFSKTDGVGTFFTQILNAARNWRDNMQAELPGYRDRVCQIRLTETEGGLNLNMSADVVKRLVERGESGRRDHERFDFRLGQAPRDAILDPDADAPAKPRPPRTRPPRRVQGPTPGSRTLQDRHRAVAGGTDRHRAATTRLVGDGDTGERRSLRTC